MLHRRGVTGWTKTGFVVRDDLINERKSMVVSRLGSSLKFRGGGACSEGILLVRFVLNPIGFE